MNTRELELKLKNLADYFSTIPEFEIDGILSIVTSENSSSICSFYNRDKFVNAVKAIGNCTKKYTEGEYAYLVITSINYPIELRISRNSICKKIVTYDCEPLFTDNEIKSL